MRESGITRWLLLPVSIYGVDLKGHGFAAIPFMEEVLRFLLGRCAWFRKEHVANPDLYLTTEFDHYCSWHDTGADKVYEGGDLEAIKALAEADEFMEAVALTEETGEFQIVDAGRVPERGIWVDVVWLHIWESPAARGPAARGPAARGPAARGPAARAVVDGHRRAHRL
jgi:hypothetical protein